MSETDYKSAHLQFIKDRPNFVPKGGTFSIPYYEVMQELYRSPAVVQELAKVMWLADIEWHKVYQKAYNDALRSFDVDQQRVFITIGFNHQTYTIQKCIDVINNIKKLDWIVTLHGVFEMHRENGEHPHFHCLITLNEKIPKSKVLEKLWAVKGIKKVVLQKTFIDYKPAQPHHEDYINLRKVSTKMPYVEKDKLWRIENNIPEKFIK